MILASYKGIVTILGEERFNSYLRNLSRHFFFNVAKLEFIKKRFQNRFKQEEKEKDLFK